MKATWVNVFAACFLVTAITACGSDDGIFTAEECSGKDLAKGQPYTKSVNADEPYVDSGDKEFTDGKYAGDLASDSGSFGFKHDSSKALTVSVDIDLGSAKKFNTVTLNSGALDPRYVASKLQILASNDKQSWTPVGTLENKSNDFYLSTTFKELTKSRYVRFSVDARSGCTDCNLLLLGEGKVNCE